MKNQSECKSRNAEHTYFLMHALNDLKLDKLIREGTKKDLQEIRRKRKKEDEE